MGRRAWSRQTAAASVSLLAVAEPRLPASPADPLRRVLMAGWQLATYGEPSAQNLTGLPTRRSHGYTARAPQALGVLEAGLLGADPPTTTRGWPVLPSRRPPLVVPDG